MTNEPAAANRFCCGTVTLAGRSNVGKSTLLNRLLGEKVAITSKKPQTTRSRILGICTLPDAQVIWVDTPGIHRARSLLNRRMVDAAQRSIHDSDAVVVVIDAAEGLGYEDRAVIATVAAAKHPWLVALNREGRSLQILSAFRNALEAQHGWRFDTGWPSQAELVAISSEAAH